MGMTETATYLHQAAETAVAAPSIFNTQPWHWQVAPTTLRLWAQRERQLLIADPEGRMLTVSCGVALHHARVALAAAGHAAVVERLPDPGDTDLLAEITLGGSHARSASEIQMSEAIPHRRTDRRAFGGDPVPGEVATELTEAAESQGAHLHLVHRDQIVSLARAAMHADALQLGDPAYRKELIRWTSRPAGSGDGVPVATAVRRAPRVVPVRDFAPYGGPVMSAGEHTDRSALYALIFTDEDNPMAWLRAGEALSAVLLTATAAGLATAPISDVTELAVTREQLRRMLSGIGYPQLAVRIGHAPPGAPPFVPRRAPNEVIYP
jgi:nitroreductase